MLKITGSTDWLQDAIETMKTGCSVEVNMNTALWQKDPETNVTIPPPDIDKELCPRNCSERGNCLQGIMKAKIKELPCY